MLDFIKNDSENIGEVSEDIHIHILNNRMHISQIVKIYTNYLIQNKEQLLNNIESCLENGALNVILIPKSESIKEDINYTI